MYGTYLEYFLLGPPLLDVLFGKELLQATEIDGILTVLLVGATGISFSINIPPRMRSFLPYCLHIRKQL